MAKSNRAKMYDAIRVAAHAVAKREALAFDEEIVAAVEEEIGWTLSEYEGRFACDAYNQRRSEVLAHG